MEEAKQMKCVQCGRALPRKVKRPRHFYCTRCVPPYSKFLYGMRDAGDLDEQKPERVKLASWLASLKKRWER